MRRELGEDHAKNQSLQLRFLGSGVELKEADMAANQPDKQDADNAYLVSRFLSLSSSTLVFGKTEGQDTMLEMLKERPWAILTAAPPRSISARVRTALAPTH